MDIIKIGVERMNLQKITFEVCPRCQSTFINQTENEHPTWQCSDCLYTFEIPLIAKFPDPEGKDSTD
jgi:transposase-like protein